MHDFRSELQKYLESGERLVWTGQPRKGLIFRSFDAFMIPFSALWLGFAIFWTYTALRGGAPFFFAAFGLIFVGVGLVLLFGRFYLDARMRANTFYAITDRRVLILSGMKRINLTTLNIKNLDVIEYSERADGSGSIYFGGKGPMSLVGSSMNWYPGVKIIPMLDQIAEARVVYMKLMEMQRQ